MVLSVFIGGSLRDNGAKQSEKEASMTATEDKFTRETITAVWPWSDNLFSLRTTRDPRYRFRAGQFARLGVRKADGDIVWRAYSWSRRPTTTSSNSFPSWCRVAPSPAN